MGTEQLLLIGGLAILDTLSPTTIGITIYLLLTDKERLTKRLFVYLLTVAGRSLLLEPYYSSQAFIFHQRKVQSSLHQNQIAFFP